MEKENKIHKRKLRHLSKLKTILFFSTLSFGYLLYLASGSDMENLFDLMIYSSYFILIFTFIITFFNIDLVASELKGKKVFDHLMLFSFFYFIFVHLSKVVVMYDTGELLRIASDYAPVTWHFFLDATLGLFLMPLFLFISIVWSIKSITTKEDKKQNSNLFFYVFITATTLLVIYSIYLQMFRFN